MNKVVIKVDNLSKAYNLYNKPIDRLKEIFNPFGKKYHHSHYAIKDISFEIKKGEAVGIIGKNGSGKSTLLKILTGVLTPTSGSYKSIGNLSSLLELGTGFNPELNGIENIYFNASILGYSKKEVDMKIQDILNFADIGEFIYHPVKVYSSGMYARLAFAVAINVDPDILIVDEVLSVGDIFFQQKCIDYINTKLKSVTKIFVSHDIYLLSQIVDRSLVFNSGKLVFDGYIKDALSYYEQQDFDKVSISEVKNPGIQSNYKKVNKFKITGNNDIQITEYYLDGFSTNVKAGDNLKLYIKFLNPKAIEKAKFGFFIRDKTGLRVFGQVSGTMQIRDYFGVAISFQWPSVKSGEYTITFGIGEVVSNNTQIQQCWLNDFISFKCVYNFEETALFHVDMDCFLFNN